MGCLKLAYSLEKSTVLRCVWNAEEQQKNRVSWYDYGARFYDPVIARWTTVDQHAEKYFEYSPFVYTYNNPIKNIDPDGMDGVRVVDNENKTITIRADYYVQSQSRTYQDGNRQRSSAGYSEKEISSMQGDYNKYLNGLGASVSDGEYKGYTVKFDLQFKAGGDPDESEKSAASDKQGDNSIGNSFTSANSTAYPRFATKEIDNWDGTVSTSTVGGVTADHKNVTMNTREDTKMNRIHEIFHTLGFNHPKGTGGSQGIMKYPPEKPTQADINQLGNGAFLPAVIKKKDDQK